MRASLCGVLRAALAGINVDLREERDEDLAFLAELYASTREAELARVDWPAAAKRDFLQQQFRAQRHWYRAQYDGAEWLLLERAGSRIGRCYLWSGEREIRLMDIALMPEMRGQGIGTRIVDALLRTAQAQGQDVTLHVEPDNPAQRLYARLGFVLEEHRGASDFLRWQPLS